MWTCQVLIFSYACHGRNLPGLIYATNIYTLLRCFIIWEWLSTVLEFLNYYWMACIWRYDTSCDLISNRTMSLATRSFLFDGLSLCFLVSLQVSSVRKAWMLTLVVAIDIYTIHCLQQFSYTFFSRLYEVAVTSLKLHYWVLLRSFQLHRGTHTLFWPRSVGTYFTTFYLVNHPLPGLVLPTWQHTRHHILHPDWGIFLLCHSDIYHFHGIPTPGQANRSSNISWLSEKWI